MLDPAESLPPLAKAMLPVLEKVAGRTLTQAELALLEEILTNHGLEGPSPPEWILNLCADILGGRCDQIGRKIPSGYPLGENGLANVLSEIELHLLPLRLNNQGEYQSWPIPACGVTVYIGRETQTPGFYTLQLIPYPQHFPSSDQGPAIPLLQHAILNQDRERVKQLLEAGADPNQNEGEQAGLLILALRQAPEMLPLLLAYGANPNQMNTYGSPLILAALSKDISSVLTLLSYGANPNLKLPHSLSGFGAVDAPLFATLHGEESAAMLAILAALLDAGADPQLTDAVGLTALAIASRDQKYQVVERLVLALAK